MAFKPKKDTPANINKHKMAVIRSKFRERGIVNPCNDFVKMFPEYNTASEGLAVRTVWNGNSGRIDIIDKFEQLYNSIS